MSPLIMVDGISADAAAIRARFPHHPVAIPVDGIGDVPWTPAQQALFARKIRFSTLAGHPLAARYARELDIERYDADPSDFPPFAEERHDMLLEDATAYRSVSGVRDVLAELNQAGMMTAPWRLHVAWWWGRPGMPTREQVATELANFGAVVDPERIWSCQYRSDAQWDLSVVYGKPDFSS